VATPSYTPTLDGGSAPVVPGDAVVSADQAGNTNVTRAQASTYPNAPAPIGVVADGAGPGGTPTVQFGGTVPASVAGLGAGAVSLVAIDQSTGKLARVPLPDGSEAVIGTCDTEGNVTVAPRQFVGTAPVHWVNVQAPPFNARGDGATPDDGAIQAALDLFSGAHNPTPGVIYFPRGTYLITRPLTFTGNVGNAVRFVADVAGNGPAGAILRWAGASGGRILDVSGLNQSSFENLCFDGARTAATTVWIHTDQGTPGGSPTNGVWFRRCVFAGIQGGTNPLVTVGDVGPLINSEVAGIEFHECYFAGSGNGTAGSPTATFSGVTVLSGSNTETFVFSGCSFTGQGMRYGAYFPYQPNNTIIFDNTAFGNISGACLWLNQGDAHVTMHQCACENGVGGVGYWIQSGQYNRVHIDSCEIIMDCSLNPDNVLFQVHGPTIIENSVVDGGGETGKTTAAVIQVNDAAVGTGVASLTVRHNTWLHATEQVPVVDAGTPGNPLTTTGGLDTTGQTGKYAIQLFGNVGSDADATTFRILPSFRGDQETLFHCGLVQAAGGPLPAGMSVGYRSETRHTTTRIDVTREALTAAGRSQLFNRFAIPFRSKIVSCIVEVTTAFAVARGIVNLTVTDGVNSGHGNWIEPSNVSITTASRGTPIGALAADLGTVLSGPNYVQGGGAWNLWATAGAREFVDLFMIFTGTEADLNTATAGALSAYITTESMWS
jgi:hypothetical protein